MRFVGIGATRYSRVSRNPPATSYSASNPYLPKARTAVLAASHNASAAESFAVFTVPRASRPGPSVSRAPAGKYSIPCRRSDEGWCIFGPTGYRTTATGGDA